jgi:hypothetical protein
MEFTYHRKWLLQFGYLHGDFMNEWTANIVLKTTSLALNIEFVLFFAQHSLRKKHKEKYFQENTE